MIRLADKITYLLKIKGLIENDLTKYHVKLNIYHTVIFVQELINKKNTIYASRIPIFSFKLLNCDRE